MRYSTISYPPPLLLEGGYSVVLRGLGYFERGDGVWRAWNRGDLENENFVLLD